DRRHEELCGFRGDGTGFCVDLMLDPVRDGEAAVTGAVGVAREVGERRRLEEVLRDREQCLVEVARMTTAGEILDGLAHEVNQPLTSISNFAGACDHLLRGVEGPEAEKARSHVRQIIEQAAAAADILRRARRFVKRSDEPIPFELGELVRESVALLWSEKTKRTIVVNVEVDRPATVMGDRSHIEQVVVNLLRNAYESFEDENGDRRVTIRVTADDSEATVSVQDNGAGIGPDEARIAETFHSTKERGLGLGLGICRTILERHHGRLWLEAGPGGGTVARFTLPLHPSRSDHV
ncbi:MAG TPA: ATP-binding protein, partial [bacterium]|nr:ATP-binding protein [bacterium]